MSGKYNDVPEHYPINLSHFINYLQKTGWDQQEHKNAQIMLFRREISDGQFIKLILPKNQNAVDYYHRISDAIDLLSSYENRSRIDIINSISSVYKDILNIRLSKGTDITSLNFDDAIDIIMNIKKLILYSASAEQDPMPYYSRPLSKANEFIKECKFGHTFRGSFGFTIESPPSHSPTIGIPFSRRVTKRVVRSLTDVQEAIFNGDIIRKNCEYGLNANMCEALLKVMDYSKGDVEYSIKWSPELKDTDDMGEMFKISLGHTASEYLEYAKKQLLPNDEKKYVTIHGKVIQLKAESIYEEEGESKEPPHKVTIETNYDGKDIYIHLNLSAADYLTACEAHMGEKMIEVSGYLEIEGIKRILISPRNFHIFDGKTLKVIDGGIETYFEKQKRLTDEWDK